MSRSGAKQRGELELIEVFAPDDATAWSQSDAQFATPSMNDGTPKPRRGVVLAVLAAVTAAIVGAIALADDGSSDSSPTTTLTTPTTVSQPVDRATGAHYFIDDAALTAYSADIVTPPLNGQQVQVWTNGTAIGPLVILELHPYVYEPYGVVGATRAVVDGIELIRPSAQPDTLISEVAIDESMSVTVTATRLSSDEVVRIVNGLNIVDAELADSLAVMDELTLGLTFEDESVEDLIFGRVESEVRYLRADGEIATLRVAVGSSEHRLAALRYLLIDPQPHFYASSVGHLPNGDAIVVWEDNGRLLSLVAPAEPGDLIPDDLILLSRHVRSATDGEWSAMLYGLRPDYTLGDFATLATGHASNTELWRAGPQLATRDGKTRFLWWWTAPGLNDFSQSAAASIGVGAQPHFDAVVVPGATFVFVSQPGSGGTVTVRADNGIEYRAELLQPFAGNDTYMTVVRIEDAGPITVAIDGVDVVP